LAAEVIWTRFMSLLLGPTVYTFSIILAVFLTGLGLGSSAGAWISRGAARPRVALGCCQWLLTAAVAWTAYQLADSLPFWPINPYLSRSPWLGFQLDLVRCLWAILPAACLWGASFPLALAAVATPGQDAGRLAGGIYAANTVGAIVGAIGTSLFVIAWLGTQNGQRILIGLSAMSGLLLLAPQFWTSRGIGPGGNRLPWIRRRTAGFLGLAAATGLSVCLAWRVPAVPWELVSFGRELPLYRTTWENLFLGEGMNAAVAVTETENGVRNFHVSGKVEASSGPADMRLQRMLGHLPALLHPKPRSVLVVGCGAGVTSGSFVMHTDVERVVICEIEPLVPKAVAPFFAHENHNVLEDPRVEIVYDDARHFILATGEKFDIITSDPIHPWVKGSAVLYTKEYFELCRRHLNPKGLMTQWVPLYQSSAEVVKSQIATFFDVFPKGTIWGNQQNGQGYDLVLLGSAEGIQMNLDELKVRLDRPDDTGVVKSLDQVGMGGAINLLRRYAGRASDLKPWLGQAEINRDGNLRLQYLAGIWLNANQGQVIYDEMLRYRVFPEDLFAGSRIWKAGLRYAILHPAPSND